MFGLALRSALARWGRLVRTAVAVLVGVAFVSGTFVLADTTNAAFERASTQGSGRYDLVLRSVAPFLGSGSIGDREPLPDTLVEQVRAVEGITDVDTSVLGYAQIVAPDGTAITPTGPPTLGTSWGLEQSAEELVAGQPPAGPGEVVLDEATFERHGFELGAPVQILFAGPSRTFTVVGVHDSSTLLGATLAVFDLPTAQGVLGKEGVVDDVRVAVDPGADAGTVRGQLEALVGEAGEVVTDDQDRQEAAETWTTALGFMRTLMLVFAGLALIVAAFLIFNTFAILLAQRTQELGLLRAIGARPGQVRRVVLGESLLVGVLASVVGLVVGVGLAVLMVSAVRAIGIDLPTTTPVVLPRTAAVSILAGVATCLLAAGIPAWRAGRLTPMAALTVGGGGDAGRWVGRRAALAAALLAGGSVLVAIGIGVVDEPVPWVGAGAVLALAGIVAATPVLVSPVGKVVGRLLARVVGEPGALGRENVLRDPRRAAVSALALMIGVSVVGLSVILAESARVSAVEAIEDSMTADLVVLPAGSFTGTGFSPQLGAELAELPQAAVASPVRMGQFGLDGTARGLVAVDPASIQDVLTYGGRAPDAFAALAPDTVAVAERVMQAQGWRVGDVVGLDFARTGHVQMPIVGTYVGETTETDSEYLVSLATHERNYTDSLDAVVYIVLAEGVGPEQGRAAVDAVLQAYPNVRSLDLAELRDLAAGQVDQYLALIGVLLVLSLVIALIGIANTVALSVAERTREIGLLRAVGMSRRQLRAMIRSEATIVGAVGVALGIAASLALSWVLVQALGGLGIDRYQVPWGRLAVVVVLALFAAAVAVSAPAARAARIPVLDAITDRRE